MAVPHWALLIRAKYLDEHLRFKKTQRTKTWGSGLFISFLWHHNLLTLSTEWFSNYFLIAWQCTTLGSRGYFFLISIFPTLGSRGYFFLISPRNMDIRKKYPLEPRVVQAKNTGSERGRSHDKSNLSKSFPVSHAVLFVSRSKKQRDLP